MMTTLLVSAAGTLAISALQSYKVINLNNIYSDSTNHALKYLMANDDMQKIEYFKSIKIPENYTNNHAVVESKSTYNINNNKNHSHKIAFNNHTLAHAVAPATGFPDHYYHVESDAHPYYQMDQDEKNDSLSEVNKQVYYTSLTTILDTFINNITRMTSDVIKSGNTSIGKYYSLINSIVSMTRFYFAYELRDKSAANIWTKYTASLRSKLILSNSRYQSTDIVENVDTLVRNRVSYHSSLCSSIIGAVFGFYAVKTSGVSLAIITFFSVFSFFKIAFTNYINEITKKFQKRHNDVELALQNKFNEHGFEVDSDTDYNAFQYYQYIYNIRVIFESLDSFSKKAIDVIAKYFFLSLMLEPLLRGFFPYTSLLPTLTIVTSFSKSLNFSDNTRKFINPSINAVDSVIENKQPTNISVTCKKKPEANNAATRSTFSNFTGAFKKLFEQNLTFVASVLSLIALYIILQYTQSYFMSQSILSLNNMMTAVKACDSNLSSRMIFKIFWWDMYEQLAKASQRWLGRYITSIWALHIRKDNYTKILKSKTTGAKGTHIIDDIKGLIDPVMSIIAALSKSGFDLWFCSAGLARLPYGMYVILGLAAYAFVKKFILDYQNTGDKTKRRTQCIDTLKNISMSSENLENYNAAYVDDLNGNNLIDDLNTLMSSIITQIQYLVFIQFTEYNYMTSTDIPGSLKTADVTTNALDALNGQYNNLTSLYNSGNRLAAADFFDPPSSSNSI